MECELNDNNNNNKFVYQTLKTVYDYFSENSISLLNLFSKQIEIHLSADNDFYSQTKQLEQLNLTASYSNLKSLKPQSKIGGMLEKVSKTGLGSSACLVASLTAAVLKWFEKQIGEIEKEHKKEDNNSFLNLAHNLAQFAHCKAQGKIGSGFDVAAALFGSIKYNRFPTDKLSLILNEETFNNLKFIECINDFNWGFVISKFQLPPYFKLALGEVNTGSNTPSMVSKVLKWKKENFEQATEIYTKLNGYNNLMSDLLDKLVKCYENDKEMYLNQLLQLQDKIIFKKQDNEIEIENNSTTVTEIIYQLSNTFQNIRHQLKLISNFANVPIEPFEQTQLLNQLLKLPGSIFGGVPGAGGYDAVFIIYIDTNNQQINNLQLIMDEYNQLNLDSKVTPLLSNQDKNLGLNIIIK
ncbi:Phosphomevalonate kinase [Neoconidiobolus thromboides FSU 785]|nr:Phosphomevalonate kinase [Neoconidiobolus thromboides FSU 785]